MILYIVDKENNKIIGTTTRQKDVGPNLKIIELNSDLPVNQITLGKSKRSAKKWVAPESEPSPTPALSARDVALSAFLDKLQAGAEGYDRDLIIALLLKALGRDQDFEIALLKLMGGE